MKLTYIVLLHFITYLLCLIFCTIAMVKSFSCGSLITHFLTVTYSKISNTYVALNQKSVVKYPY